MKKKKYYDLEIGQICKNNSGNEYEVVNIIDCKNVKIKFVGRDYSKTVTALYAFNGNIRLPKYLIGDTFHDMKGNFCKIVNKVGENYMIAWEDGYTRVVKSCVFTLGILREDDSTRLNPSIKVGMRFKNLQGVDFEVTQKLKNFKYIVKFDKPVEYEVEVCGSNIHSGAIHYPHIATVAGVGILGKFSVDVRSKEYVAWAGMLKRCYNPFHESTKITYEGVTVCDEWLYYENFHKWATAQRFQDGWHLDKDLLVKGNKIYSPEACVFLPRELNTFLTDRRNHRGLYPKGVTYRPHVGNFQATCNYKGEPGYIGVYETPELAFAAYKSRKEAISKELAQEYSGLVDDRAVEALLNYTVDISD